MTSNKRRDARGTPPLHGEEYCCDVAVCRPLHRRFTYLIPPGLKQGLVVGSRVRVSFGRARVLGFVVGLRPLRFDDPLELKYISELVDAVPPLPEGHLELARWMSEQFFCSEGEALSAMVPARHTRREDCMVALTGTADECLAVVRSNARRQRQLIEALREGARSRASLSRLGAWVPGAIRSAAAAGLVREHPPDEVLPCPTPGLDAQVHGRGEFLSLTPDQQRCFDEVAAVLSGSSGSETFLLHGVTGSGKTEIYLHLIRYVLERGEGAVFLVPEISLTVPMIRLFKSRFGEILAVLHSRLTPVERYREWLRIKSGNAMVVLGARSAVFAPVQRPALFILDEEGEGSYKQQDPPRYHARSVALFRASRCGAVVVLGSATPSLDSYYRARYGGWKYLRLPNRIGGRPMPEVSLVDMSEEFSRKRNRSVFSTELKERLYKTLAGGGQALLFLNRRGHSTYVFCRECSYVCTCPDCSVSYTFHFSSGWMVCHHCGRACRPPSVCPGCESRAIRYCGAGTQKVEQEFRLNFPAVPYARMDSDTTTARMSHERIFDDFARGKTRVLIGTQMVARGFDFKNLDLAGVVNADSTLNMPDFRAAERTFSLLTQVAGRVGRGTRPCHVVVQSYSPSHPALRAAARHDYELFAERELPLRRELWYPPYSRLVVLLAGNKIEDKARLDLESFAKQVNDKLGIALERGSLELVGPGPALVQKLKKIFRWQLMIKLDPDDKGLFDELRETVLSFKSPFNSKIKVNVDPVNPV